MTILDYPNETCQACHSDTWYYMGGSWRCGVCHPPGSEQETLKMRIIKGNYMLTKRRRELSPEELLETIARLRELSWQLLKPDCLYFDGKKKLKKCVPAFHGEGGIECFTCRNDYWFETEIADMVKRKGVYVQGTLKH